MINIKIRFRLSKTEFWNYQKREDTAEIRVPIDLIFVSATMAILK
jgi:hypothetical protein